MDLLLLRVWLPPVKATECYMIALLAVGLLFSWGCVVDEWAAVPDELRSRCLGEWENRNTQCVNQLGSNIGQDPLDEAAWNAMINTCSGKAAEAYRKCVNDDRQKRGLPPLPRPKRHMP